MVEKIIKELKKCYNNPKFWMYMFIITFIVLILNFILINYFYIPLLEQYRDTLTETVYQLNIYKDLCMQLLEDAEVQLPGIVGVIFA